MKERAQVETKTKNMAKLSMITEKKKNAPHKCIDIYHVVSYILLFVL